jgi:PrtD family type I secretion system ABC transporter
MSVSLPRAPARAPAQSELSATVAACRRAFISIGLFSGIINVLGLTGAFFMLQIYDRVLPGRSVPTLVVLVIFAAVLFAFLGILDLIRSRVLVRIGAFVDQSLSARIYAAAVDQPLKGAKSGDGLQAFRDLDQVRSFLSSTGPAALFDLPWLPVYLVICFLFHPWIGVSALLGAILLVSLAFLTNIQVREPTRAANKHAGSRNALAEASRRNAEVLRAMGMTDRLSRIWAKANTDYVESHQRASDLSGSLGAVSRVLRMAIQAGILAVGAYLVIQQEATGGVIIASALLSARALAPVEQAISNWKTFLGARQAWHRLTELLGSYPQQAEQMGLPGPKANLAVEAISVAPPGTRRIVVQDVTFSLKSGNGLGIIGPSASGKSSHARALVGVWGPARGNVRLDGAALDQWSPAALGNHIGYLPQDVELFAGTVAQNIARFDPDAHQDAIIAAARTAGVHEVILRLPEGYETQIGEGGTALSAGQCQRIALARALYGDPFLVVLDEPNSNLDAEGDLALTQAVRAVRARGGIAIVIAHRPSAIEGVDLVLKMKNGKALAFGAKDDVLQKVLRPPQLVSPTLKAVGEGDRNA